MPTPAIQQYIKAISNPDNFKTHKSFRVELNDNGTPVMYQNENVLGFRMYCSQLKRSLAVSCFVGQKWLTNYYLEKIAEWHNRNKDKTESPVFLYLYGELSIKDYSNHDIIVSEWNDEIETNFSFNIENSVRIVDEVAFSADMTRLIAFPLPNKLIRSYAIPEGVTTIGAKAFEACTQVLEVTIPKSVTTIEDEAFYCSFNIKSLNIPDTVTHIGAGAFSMLGIKTFHIPVNVKITGSYFISCSNLMTITLGKNHPLYVIVDNVLFSHDKKILLRYPPACLNTTYTVPDGVEMIGYYAFSGSNNLTAIAIPESVVSICESAFEGVGIKTFSFPKNISFIGENLFENCYKLESFTFPLCITKISKGLFSNCESMTSFTIPNHITVIEDYAFTRCENLEEINIPNSVVSIGESAFFGCSKLTSVIIPSSVKSIGESAFELCAVLEEVAYYGEISVIEASTFAGCSKLSSIILPKGLTRINESAFSDCEELKSIEIPEGVTEIGENAFSSCTELYSVQLPHSLISIEEEAFWNCNNLIKIDLSRNITFVGDNAFEHCDSLNYGFKLGLTNRFGERVF
jgi:hypothetical protein